MVQHLDLLIAGSQQRALCAVRAALDADIMIGETLADAENPIPLPLITVDEPAISMVVGTNTSPLVGKVKGSKVTARMVKDRLDRELSAVHGRCVNERSASRSPGNLQMTCVTSAPFRQLAVERGSAQLGATRWLRVCSHLAPHNARCLRLLASSIYDRSQARLGRGGPPPLLRQSRLIDEPGAREGLGLHPSMARDRS